MQQSVALAASASITLVAGVSSGFGRASIHDLALLALSGVVTLAVPFPLYLASLAHLDAPIAAQYLALIPVFGITGAIVFLGETVRPLQLCGAVVIVGALVMASRAGAPRSSVTAAPRKSLDVSALGWRCSMSQIETLGPERRMPCRRMPTP